MALQLERKLKTKLENILRFARKANVVFKVYKKLQSKTTEYI